ncbi:hypothetical protein [Marinomonas algicola]|nr:hypothetical protein [Marinomonas algicola]
MKTQNLEELLQTLTTIHFEDIISVPLEEQSNFDFVEHVESLQD